MARALLAQAARRRLSDTQKLQGSSSHAFAMGSQLHAGGVEKVDEAWRLGEGGQGRLLDPQAETEAVELLAHKMQWSLSWGSARGRGFWGVPTSLEDGGRGEKLLVPLEGRLLPGAICIRSIKTRAGVTCQWPWVEGRGLRMRGGSPERHGAGMSPREKSTSHRSHPVTCLASLHGDHGLLPSHPGTQ